MKKFSLALYALALGSSVAMASTAPAVDMSGYYSSQHPLASAVTTARAALAVSPTDITIINATPEVIFAVVGNGAINDAILPEKNDHIKHPSMYGDTFLTLQDPTRYSFFQGNVCRQAVVSVFGSRGNYRINVDRDYCY